MGVALIGHAYSCAVAVSTGRWLLVIAAAAFLGPPAPVLAADRYALVIIGAAGEPKYEESYGVWQANLTSAFTGRLGFPADRVAFLSERAEAGIEKATADQLRRTVAGLRSRLRPDDLLLVILIGHGTFDGERAKFNIVGPDLDDSAWAELLRGVPGRLVIVNTTGASFPFLQSLSTPGRVVVTATDSAAQRYETVFPEYFIEALNGDGADADKNGRVSVWEAFAYASLSVRQWYEQRGQLSTERSLLDDTGDGLGKEAGAPGPDGTLARSIYLDSETAPATGPEGELATLNRRRAQLEQQIESLKDRKSSLSPEEFADQFEKLVTELARVSKEIRSKS